MVLTYSMVMGRLDTLNQRETQVRKFYKPLPDFKKEEGKPYPRRHRFADVLEPGDVVRTIDKGGEGGGWDEGMDGGGGERESPAQQSTGSAADGGSQDLEHKGAKENRALGPGRDSQRLISQTAKRERQLRKAIDGELNERTEKLKTRLYREAGVAQNGEELPPDDENDKIDPLFKQVGKAQMMFPKPPVHKTGIATALELTVSQTVPRFASGTAYRAREADFAHVEQEAEITVGQMDQAQEEKFERAASAASALSGRGGFQRTQQETMLEEEEEIVNGSDEEEPSDMFEGPVSTWGYRKSTYSEHDDPERREFYFTQLTLAPEELMLDAVNNSYLVHMKCMTLPNQPEHICAAAGRNDQGKLLFQRAGESDDTIVLSTILSTADELPWVTDPTQLMGQQLKITIYRRHSDSNPAQGDTLVSERTVTFRAPPAAQRPMIPAYPHPPTSAPGGNARDHGRPHLASHSGAAAATRPGTAPVTSPSKDGLAPLYMRATPSPVDVTGRRGASGAPAVQGGSPNSKSVSPAARWNTWAENGSMEPGALQHPMIRELSQDNKSFEESPAAKKKKELARMRQQMRASLQQTQTQVLASMGGVLAGVSAQGAAYLGGAASQHVQAPMKIVSQPGLSAQGSSSSRPGTSASVRFR